VLPAAIPCNEAEALRDVEPFHRAGLLDRRVGRWPVRCLGPETGWPWCWGGSAAIDAQYFGDVWPLVTWAVTHFESFARLDSADPAVSQQAPMKKGVARSVREFDEAEAFLGTEPFDNGADRRAGKGLEPGLAEPGSGAECAGSVDTRYQRRTRDAANYGNLDVSLWFREGWSRCVG
jgi:hypothetical protein